MGRPTALTPELIVEVGRLVHAGTRPEAAMRGLGVSHSTFFGWLARGRAARRMPKQRAGDAVYRQMVDAIEEAQAKSETFLATAAMTAATKNPALASSMLSRMSASKPKPMPAPAEGERSWDVTFDE